MACITKGLRCVSWGSFEGSKWIKDTTQNAMTVYNWPFVEYSGVLCSIF